jgi:hypothetical protein
MGTYRTKQRYFLREFHNNGKKMLVQPVCSGSSITIENGRSGNDPYKTELTAIGQMTVFSNGYAYARVRQLADR